MKRTKEKRSVITYHLSPVEHAKALKDYIESHRTEDDNLQGFVPNVDRSNVLSVTCSWEEGDGASVSIVYSAGAKTDQGVRCAACEQWKCVCAERTASAENACQACYAEPCVC